LNFDKVRPNQTQNCSNSPASFQKETNKKFPEPITKKHLQEIKRNSNIYDSFHEEKVVCAICDQICLISRTKLVEESVIPESVFTVLKIQDDKENSDGLHPILIEQYEVSSTFQN